MRFISRFKLLYVIAALVSSVAVHAGEPPAEPMLRIDPSEHTGTIWRIATDEQGRWLATASHDKTVRLWSLADGHLLTTIRPPIGTANEGKLQAVAMSPDGAVVAAAGWTQFNHGKGDIDQDGHSIYLFDRASGRLLRRLAGLPNTITYLAFSPDGRWLTATLGDKDGVRVFDTASGQMLAEDRDYGHDGLSAHFSNDGRLLTTSGDGLLRLYRFDGSSLALLAKRAAPGGKQPAGARFSPDGQRIAVGFTDTAAVNVLDGASLALLFAPDTAAGVVGNKFSRVAWSQDGEYLYASGWTQKIFDGRGQLFIRRWNNGGTGATSDWPVASRNTIFDLAVLPGGRLAFGSSEPSWGVLDATGQKVFFHASVLADFRTMQDGFKLSYNGAQVGFYYAMRIDPNLLGNSSTVFDILRRNFLPADTTGLTPPLLTAPGMAVTLDASRAPKLNGKPLTLKSNTDTPRSLALWPDGGLAMGTDFFLQAYARGGAARWRQIAHGNVWCVNISTDGHWVVAAYGDGTIRWHRASDGVEQLAFYPHPDKKRWVLWTPTGFYDASPGAEDMIGWHLNRGKDQMADFFPASRFRNQFNRPDVIAKVLESGSETEAVKLANTEAGRKTQAASIIQVLPPIVEIVLPNEGASVATASITLKYSTRAPNDAPVTGMRARVNGLAVNLPDARNLTVTATAGMREITLPIPPQDSEIQLFAENKNGVSTPATLRVTWAGKKAVKEEDSRFKPNLYVLAVGVSKYKNPDYNLGLAAKDATDFAAVFQKQEDKLYGKVTVHLLTDDKASRDDIVDGLEWLKREVTSRDVGVIFLAGHGMNDNTGKYYFLPHNADPEKLLRTGVPQVDIKDTLNVLAGKAVFFADTCHSGNALVSAKTRSIGGCTDINAFVNELSSAENGVIVFSSSTGRQLSQEDPAWGNGAFTKAVVEGLNGKAEIGKSGKITHKGLDYYVTERVKELTKGQQSPVSNAPGGITDFPIAVVR